MRGGAIVDAYGGEFAGQEIVFAGGLVGRNFGTIDGASATAPVSGGNGASVGGLVGKNAGTITNSKAPARCPTAGTPPMWRMVGNSTGSITTAFATGAATGGGSITIEGTAFNSSVGGLVGFAQSGSIAEAYATGAASSGGYSGGLIGFELGRRHAGLCDRRRERRLCRRPRGHEHRDCDRRLFRHHDDRPVLAARASTRRADARPRLRSNYAGFDFATVWSPPNQVGQNNGSATAFYPQLYALSNVVAVDASNATRVYGQPNNSAILDYYGLPSRDILGLGVSLADFSTFITTLANVTSSATATSGVGTGYPITALAGANATIPGADIAYRFVYEVPATLSITPALLTPSLTGTVEKTYDGTTAATLAPGNIALSGLANGDAVTASGGGTYADPNVGTAIPVTLGTVTLSGANASDYVLAPIFPSADIGVIVPAQLTAALTGGVEKTYDGTTAARPGPGRLLLGGFVPGQSATVTQTSGTYASRQCRQRDRGQRDACARRLHGRPGTLAHELHPRPAHRESVGAIGRAPLIVSLTGTVEKTYDQHDRGNAPNSGQLYPGSLCHPTNPATRPARRPGPTQAPTPAAASGSARRLTPSDFTAGPGTCSTNYMLRRPAHRETVGRIDSRGTRRRIASRHRRLDIWNNRHARRGDAVRACWRATSVIPTVGAFSGPRSVPRRPRGLRGSASIRRM